MTDGDGAALTVIVVGADAVHPLLDVTVTV
jgi:hypothetical protein